MAHFGGVKFVPQDFVAYNRGDMFVPSGMVGSGDVLASAKAAPDLLGGKIVHAVPVSYLKPNANVRTHNAIGMATPAVSANTLTGGVLK